jgi:hypothetical protein
MALFVDGLVAGVDDLTNQDSGLLDVAQTCGINVTTKIALAHDEIAADLQLWLDRPRTSLDMVWRPVLHIGQVVVTPALKRWETMQALALFYRDAYFSQLADRYQAKWDQYSKLTRTAYEKYMVSGMGLVNNPVPQAPAPVLGSVAGPQQGGTFYACISWLNAMGGEGAASVTSSIDVADNYLMTVSAPAAPGNVTGFNVYAGASLNAMALQNDVALPPGGSFTYVPGFVTQGRLPGPGQVPEFTRPLVRMLLRG